MDIGEFRGVVTAVLFVLFVGVLISAFSRRRKADYRAAERLPLEDDGAPPAGAPHEESAETAAQQRAERHE